MEVADGRCQFWLPNKRRQCANSPLPNSMFCGNHSPVSNDQRVPCPIDPSHYVLKRSIESHILKCPKRKNVLNLEAQPFYKKGINCEKGDGAAEFTKSRAKKNDIYQLSVQDFLSLIKMIKELHSAISKEVFPLRESFILSETCKKWVEGGRGEKGQKLPFQEKHAMQQASILGNMDKFGLLEKEIQSGGRIPAVVEFGAGRGYLTQMLADCYGFRDVYLVERRSYKLKADRSLRQKDAMSLERLRIDIEDLDLNGVESLKEHQYLAIGKHLCGPATDLTLRCCIKDDDGNSNFHGLAIATCCHHLCQWDQYINKEYFSRLGISPEQFNAITWFSSWAVDGTNGPGFQEDSSHLSTTSALGNGVEEIVKQMSPEEKGSLGRICKEMIDLGRLQWLRGPARKADMVKYVDRKISPENHLLLAS